MGKKKQSTSLDQCIHDLRNAADGKVRQAAAKALADSRDDESLDALLAALSDDPESGVRISAARTLAKRNDPRTAEPLICAFNKALLGYVEDAHSEFDEYAQVLGRLKDTRAIPALIAGLSSETPKIRERVRDVLLNEVGQAAIPSLAAELENQDNRILTGAAAILSKLGYKVTQPLLDALVSPHPATRMGAATALGDLRAKKAVLPLVAALRDDDIRVVQAAARSLGRLNDRRATAPLLSLLRSEQVPVRRAAVEALGSLRDPNALDPLIATLAEEALAEDAGKSIAQFSPAAINPLIALFRDERENVRESAVRILSQIGIQCVMPLVGCLAESESRVRLAAARTLGLIRYDWIAFKKEELTASIGSLLSVISDKDPEVRKAAFLSLGILGGTLHKAPFDRDHSLAMKVLDTLTGALSDEDVQVRVWAATALGLFGADECAAPLREVLQDRDEQVRKAAADALKRNTELKTYSAGQKVGPGKYVCIDCGKELTLDKSEQDLRKCPSCACEEYQCFPMTHIRPDIKTPELYTGCTRLGKTDAALEDFSESRFSYRASYDFQPSSPRSRGPPKMARPPARAPAISPASSPADHTAEKEPPAGTGTGSTRGSAAEPRYANVTFVHEDDKESELDEKAPLMINTPYLLKVAVLTTPPSRDGPPVAIRDPQQDHPVTIHVAAEGEDFTITEPVQTLILPPSGNTTVPATFHIQAKRETPDPDSRSTIELSLYFNYFLIARIIVEAEVVGQTKKDPVSRFGLAPPIRICYQPLVREIPDPGSVLPRMMNIRIQKEVSGYSLKFLYPEKGVAFTASLQLNEADLEDRIMRVRKLWYRIAMSKTFLSQLNGDDIEFTENVRDLAREGCRLWNLLFKRENESAIFKVGRFFKSNPLPEDSIIQVFFADKGSTDFVFPWALLYDRDLPENRNELPDPDGFWGIRYVIEQRMYNTPTGDKPVSTECKKPRLGFMLCDQFENTQKQIDLFKDLTAKSSGRFEVNDPITYAQDCYELLERYDSGCDILYFYTHGYTRQRLTRHDLEPEYKIFLEMYDTFDADLKEKFRRLYDGIKNNQYNLDDSWMELTDGIVYLEKLYSRVGNESDWTAKPIVFLNMCESAQVTPSLSDGFIRFFLDRGASCVIGTECPMSIEFAHPFAEKFFNGLLSGDSVGKVALNASRSFIRNNKNPLGLAYTIYGSVTPSFKPPPIQRPAVTALTGQPSGNG